MCYGILIVEFPVCCICCCCCRRKKGKPASCAGSQPAKQRASGSELCGRKQALPAFSTDAPPYDVSVFINSTRIRVVLRVIVVKRARKNYAHCNLRFEADHDARILLTSDGLSNNYLIQAFLGLFATRSIPKDRKALVQIVFYTRRGVLREVGRWVNEPPLLDGPVSAVSALTPVAKY